jgi:DNA-binding transcriptional ArsR family regulator
VAEVCSYLHAAGGGRDLRVMRHGLTAQGRGSTADGRGPSILGRPIPMASTPDNDELLKALRNPVSRKILFVLNEKPEGATIRQLSARLKEPSRRVRHYIEVLVEDGLVVVEDERRSRGTIERTFRAPRLPLMHTGDWDDGLDPAEAKLLLLDILRLAFDAVTGAIGAGTFLERAGWCAVRNWREVDPQGWDELAEIHLKAARDVIAVVDAAAERLAEGEGEVIPAISALLLFEALPWAE